MGNYFTSLLIQNKDRLSHSSFLKLFKSEMKKSGYEVCKEDSAELSYTIRYGINWATVYSEKYVPGGSDVRNDAAQFAKILETFCLNTAVIDSDCAIIDLYGKDGNKMDMIIMGRADDYFGSDIPEPSEEIWKPFLADGYTWEQLCSIRNGDYVFVEEGLELLAKALEIDVENIMFTGEESDKNTVCLSFRTAEAKKAKKLTLKTAFVQVFGEALEPLGFVRIKSKHPYFVRIVNDEILHVLTFKKECNSKNRFNIYAGVATIYRSLIDFDQSVDYNTTWLSPIRFFEYNNKDVKNLTVGIDYEFESDDTGALVQALLTALEHTKKYILPTLEKVCTLVDTIVFYHIYHGNLLQFYSVDEWNEYNHDDNEGLIYFKIDDHSDMKSEYERLIDHEKNLTEIGILNQSSDIDLNRYESLRKKRVAERDAIYDDEKAYHMFMQEISCNRIANIKRLRQYGLIISK